MDTSIGKREYTRLNDTIRHNGSNTTTSLSSSNNNNHHNGPAQFDFADFSTTGKVLTAEEKAKAAKSRGICPSCGVQTHALVGPMKHRKRISNVRVHNGVCIRCNPELIPADVYQQYSDLKKFASLHGIYGDSAYDLANSSSNGYGGDNGNGNNGSKNRKNFSRRMAMNRTDASTKLNVPSSSKLAVEAFLEARKKVHLPVSARRQVMESWDLVKDDVAGLGMDFFIRIFDRYPHLKALFPLGDDPKYLSNDELRGNPALRVHATAAMSMLGNAAAGLSDMETLLPKLRELGRMHTNIGVLPEYYDLVYSCLMETVAKKVGPSKWTAETQEAWKMCYQLITSVMKDPSRFLDVEPPEGWGLVHSVTCAYLCVVTPFRLAGFGGIYHGPLTWVLNILDFFAFLVCLFDGFSDRIEVAASIGKLDRFRRQNSSGSHGSIIEESEFDDDDDDDDDGDESDKRAAEGIIHMDVVQKKWRKVKSHINAKLSPLKFRLSRYIRGQKLGRYSHWPMLDTVIVVSFSLQHSIIAKWARRTSGFEWIYFLISVVRCISLIRVLHFVKCAELVALKRNILTKERYQTVQLSLLVASMLYIIHVCGCMYAVVTQLAFLGGGDSDGDGLLDSGFAVKMHPLLESGRTLHAYLHGLYWAFTNVTGIGHHGGSPETSLEFIFAITVHLAGAGYYILAAGNIMNLMQNRAETVYKVEEGISALTSFMDGCDIPKVAQDKFVSAYMMKSMVSKNTLSDRAGGSEPPTSRPLVPDAAQQLPIHLSMELNLFSRAKALRTRGIKLASDDFAFAVVESLIQNLTLLHGDYLFQVGKKVTPRVILVDSGVLEIFVDGVSKGCLYPGDVIGKGWLATLPMENQESSRHKSFLDWRSSDGTVAIADIRAMTECKLVIGLAKRSEVAHLQSLFPEDMKRLAVQCQPSSANHKGSNQNWNKLRGKVLKHANQSMPMDNSGLAMPVDKSKRSSSPPLPHSSQRMSLDRVRKGRSLSPFRTLSLPVPGPTVDPSPRSIASPSTKSIKTEPSPRSSSDPFLNGSSIQQLSSPPPLTGPSVRMSSSVQASKPTTNVRGGNSLRRDVRGTQESFTSISSNGSGPTVVSDDVKSLGAASAIDGEISDSGRVISRAESHRSLSALDDTSLGGSSSRKTSNSMTSSVSRKLKGFNFLRMPKSGGSS